MVRKVPAAALAVALLAAMLLVGSSGAAGAEGTAGDAVVAFIDTGINPYHEVFRDPSPRAQQHPSTYLPGFPADAVRLDLTFDAEDYAQAVEADCETVWKTVEPGTLYWVPGTRVIGAISFDAGATHPLCEGTNVLDSNGHGTMVASRAAAGTDWSACPECLIVSVQYPGTVNLISPGGSTGPVVAAIEWAAANA